MTLRIKLGAAQRVVDHPLGISEVGWEEGLTPADYLSRGRGVWKLSADSVLDEEEIFICSPAGLIVAVAGITGVTKYGDRRAVEARLLIRHSRHGTYLAIPALSRNPVSYADEDAAWAALPALAVDITTRGIQAAAAAALRGDPPRVYFCADGTFMAGGAYPVWDRTLDQMGFLAGVGIDLTDVGFSEGTLDEWSVRDREDFEWATEYDNAREIVKGSDHTVLGDYWQRSEDYA